MARLVEPCLNVRRLACPTETRRTLRRRAPP